MDLHDTHFNGFAVAYAWLAIDLDAPQCRDDGGATVFTIAVAPFSTRAHTLDAFDASYLAARSATHRPIKCGPPGMGKNPQSSDIYERNQKRDCPPFV
jgi:hypothetical protein